MKCRVKCGKEIENNAKLCIVCNGYYHGNTCGDDAMCNKCKAIRPSFNSFEKQGENYIKGMIL